MDRRLELQSLLESILGSRQVYYRPPSNLSMTYPCIVYDLEDIDQTYANNLTYKYTNRYTIKVISKTHDHPSIRQIIQLPYSNYDRHYISDNLNHDVIYLYY